MAIERRQEKKRQGEKRQGESNQGRDADKLLNSGIGYRLAATTALLVLPLAVLVVLYVSEISGHLRFTQQQKSALAITNLLDNYRASAYLRLGSEKNMTGLAPVASDPQLELVSKSLRRDFPELLSDLAILQQHRTRGLPAPESKSGLDATRFAEWRDLQQLYRALRDRGSLSSDRDPSVVFLSSLVMRDNIEMQGLLINLTHDISYNISRPLGSSAKGVIAQQHVQTSRLSNYLQATLKAKGASALAAIDTTEQEQLFVDFSEAAEAYLAQTEKLLEKKRRLEFLGMLDTDGDASMVISEYDLATLDALSEQLYQSINTLSETLRQAIDDLVGARLKEAKLQLLWVSLLVGITLLLASLLGYYLLQNIGVIQQKLGQQNELLEEVIARRVADIEAAKQRSDNLNKNLAAQTQRANQMALKAEEANKAKSLFLASMSHEIRTPLNAVLGTSAILAKTSLSKEQAGQLKLIRSSGQTLLALINEILDFSKIEAGQLRLESVAFDLEETLLETLNMLSYRANEQQLRLFWQFDSSLEGEFIGDPTRVKQVVINLLSNAVKFTRKGYVELRVKRAELGDLQCDALALSESVGADAQMIVIEVEDTGMGIAADKIDSLFDAFTQSDNSITREYGGTGLGLAITKRLLKMMGGGIEIESEQGKGSLFRMCLPLTPSPASVAEKTPQVQVQSQQAPVRILVIGDTSLFTPRVVRRLAPWGYQLSELDPGDNMLDRLHQADVLRSDELPAELIIVEQHRGMVEGSALSRVIRQFYSSAQLPVIAVSDIHLSCNIEALQRDGINGLAALALKGEVLRDMLEAVLNERGEERSKDGALFHHPQGSSEDQTEDDAIFSGRVLVVEDVEANRQVAAAILDDLGLSFRFAENGQQGLEIWKASLANKQQHFDLILMDLHMPVMDGLSATRAIREYEAQCRERRKGGFLATPIIVLSADVLQDTRQELETSGVDGYVSKPILLESLTSELKKYLPWQLRQSSTGQDEASLVSAGEIADGADLAVVDKPVVDKPVVDRPVVDRPVVDQTDADTEIFNYQELFQRVRKREDRVKSLTASFLENFAQYDADLQQALNSGDYAAIELHGHSIKGSAANLAAKQLSTLAAGIEQGAKAHEDLEHLRQQGALVTEAFERFSQEVARLIV